MFTGRYPHQLAADWAVPLEAGCPTLAQVLHDRGYLTAGFVANTWNAGRQTGLDRGFACYLAHRLRPLEILVRSALCRTLLHPPRKNPPAWAINADFSRWLAHSPRRPFFAFLNYNDCHAPYEPEPQDQHASRAEQRAIFLWGVGSPLEPQPDTNPERLNLVRDAYDNCLRGLDRRISALLQGLEVRGDLKNTIVIIVGDHGEQFGEHNLIQHSDSLYRPALHVPLLIIAPNSPVAGQRVHQMVTLRDLPATILDLLKLPQGGIAGDSFAAAITTSADAPLPSSPKFAFVSQGIKFPGWHPNADGPVGAVFLDGKYYIRNAIQEELYDFQTDPDEQHNLIDSPDSRLLLDRLRPLLPARAPQ
jgi:arylsulfatase A-like enzyme